MNTSDPQATMGASTKMKTLTRMTGKNLTRITLSDPLFLRMGPLAIIVGGLVLTMVWASLLGYGFFALVTSAI